MGQSIASAGDPVKRTLRLQLHDRRTKQQTTSTSDRCNAKPWSYHYRNRTRKDSDVLTGVAVADNATAAKKTDCPE